MTKLGKLYVIITQILIFCDFRFMQERVIQLKHLWNHAAPLEKISVIGVQNKS